MRSLSVLALAALLALQGCAAAVVATGAGVAGVSAADRRTTGIQVEDESIELKASNRISSKLGDQVHINVTSYNRNVLLTGEAPTEALRAEAEKLTASVENVRAVTNEVAISGISTFGSRSNDTYITSKVKARFVDQGKFSPLDVKVVTENGVVYLMGLVTHAEAEQATEIARTTGGVRKVVKVFEYID
jgi:osmotically-inducible protein OsmY